MAFLETMIPATFFKGVPGQCFLRQYGFVPQTLAANNVPVVVSQSGLGTGGGAGMGAMASNGNQGYINLYTGPGCGAGSVVIAFPSTPPSLFCAGDGPLGAISFTPNVDDVTIRWAGSSLMVPGQTYRLSFQWATSK